MSGKPRVKEIVVRRPRLRAVLHEDGRWNVAELLPLPRFSDDSPAISIVDATLLLEDATRHNGAPLSLRGIDLKLAAAPATNGQIAANKTLELRGTIYRGTSARADYYGQRITGSGHV